MKRKQNNKKNTKKGGGRSFHSDSRTLDPPSSSFSAPRHARNPTPWNPAWEHERRETSASSNGNGGAGVSRRRSSDVQNKHQTVETLTRRDRKREMAGDVGRRQCCRRPVGQQYGSGFSVAAPGSAAEKAERGDRVAVVVRRPKL